MLLARPPQSGRRLRFTAHLPLATNNSAQAATVKWTVLVNATQTAVLSGTTPVVSGTWSGTFQGVAVNPLRGMTTTWPFVATVTQTGNTFAGTLVEPEDPGAGINQISGTKSGNQITGTRFYPTGIGDWPVHFTGTIQPNGTVVIGSWSNGSGVDRTWTGTKQ